MKKRFLICLFIIAAITSLTIWGGYSVRQFQRHMDTALDSISDNLKNELPADTEADACLSDFRGREHILTIFLRRDYLSEMDKTLSAMKSYLAQDEKKEALAEIARARSQIYAIEHLFSRMF